MYKVLIFLISSILFTACIGSNSNVDPSKKAFEQEDTILMIALRAEQLGEYSSASSMFETLYDKSGKKEYLYRSLENDLMSNQYEKMILRIDDEMDDSLDDLELIRMKVLALINLSKFKEAKNLGLLLVEKSQEIDDYILVSDIYVKLSKFNTAIKYLEGAYSKDYNEKILDKIAVILYVNLERKKDAIAHLETHAKIHGCSKVICNRLLSIYSNENDIDALLRIYLKLYELDKSEQVAQKIVQIYGYTKDYIKLIDFLEESQSDNKLLLQMYMQVKNYKKAAPLSQKLYEETANIAYLAQSAIYEYESSDNKDDEDMQQRVIEKLKSVVLIEPKALYYNYLGYILIDHSIDIEEGMVYIEKALEKQPSSAYYLDSKAWGFYKLGECKKAYELIKKVVKMDGGDEQEVQDHFKIIKKCKRKK